MPDINTISHPQLITPKALAERLGVTVETLKNWRNEGRGPNYVKFSPGSRGHVRYRLSDVIAWEDSLPAHCQTVQQDAEAAYGRL